MNDEPTGPCPLNCRRTARPVRYSFLLNVLELSVVNFWLGDGDL